MSQGNQTMPSSGSTEAVFRRLLAAMDTEHEQLASAQQQVDQEHEIRCAEIDRTRRDTTEWCQIEKCKVDAEWERLDNLTRDMEVFWTTPLEMLEINCSGSIFTVPRSTLMLVTGSSLSQMFSNDFISDIPRDNEGRLFLDFNPHCFAIVIDYLRNRRLRPDAPLPITPPKHQRSMNMLVEALKLTPFLTEIAVNAEHGTSLYIIGNMIQATMPGWQVVSASSSLSPSRSSYFEVKIVANPNNARGGLAVGVCGHMPTGNEVHTIRLSDAVLYNSHNGIIGDCTDSVDVEPTVELQQGDIFGVRVDAPHGCLAWYHNGRHLGISAIKPEAADKMQSLYPVFALFTPDTKICVDFHPESPPQ